MLFNCGHTILWTGRCISTCSRIKRRNSSLIKTNEKDEKLTQHAWFCLRPPVKVPSFFSEVPHKKCYHFFVQRLGVQFECLAHLNDRSRRIFGVDTLLEVFAWWCFDHSLFCTPFLVQKTRSVLGLLPEVALVSKSRAMDVQTIAWRPKTERQIVAFALTVRSC